MPFFFLIVSCSQKLCPISNLGPQSKDKEDKSDMKNEVASIPGKETFPEPLS
jgi:hypothetical protein